ncbi:uncharacterized protein LAESUDRAFT_731302 [Laetiporus sulphureus 93-53]|uniref:Uncharacterized protein n=1 Tax=Laetiporus sulphureus 93-53 TaxID=1314785 RepID=A0A165BMJ8_9APHY|nr:uncharacterized protein LAESUDRAFT_731302 [Laetiporus sulphureus 93-53]KZT01313.1 hypothetical protein LAESUDRAFT_731302 [Laetiporus sulphureus 93-53]
MHTKNVKTLYHATTRQDRMIQVLFYPADTHRSLHILPPCDPQLLNQRRTTSVLICRSSFNSNTSTPINTHSTTTSASQPISTVLNRRRTPAHLDHREHKPTPEAYVRTVHTCERQRVPVALDILRTKQDPGRLQLNDPAKTPSRQGSTACRLCS